MRAVTALVLLPLLCGPLAAKEEAPSALSWHHTGFVKISQAANEAKAKSKRLLLGLSGSET